ncbi:MAG TPA: flagellar basal body P-ring formation chaperone FlgA [Phycisphaerae bacterium]|nr:flagellar basal body P-ring formation chaperone FlgA [Phycisphaerae bacterium]
MRDFGYTMIAMVGGMLISLPAFGQVIRLEKQAVVARGQNVRLGNIATIKGADEKTAAALADTVVISGIETNKKVAADAVLMAVMTQLGANGLADRLEVAGAAQVEIVVGEGQGKSEVGSQKSEEGDIAANAPVAVAQAEGTAVSVVTASVVAAPDAEAPAATQKTLADIITDAVGDELGVGKEDYRVRFDSLNPLLNQVPAAGAHWDVHPMTQSTLGTLPFSAELIQGTRILQRTMVQAIAERKTQVLCAAEQIHSGTVMTKEAFRTQEMWLDRNLPTLFTGGQDIVGLQAQRDVMAGSMLDQRDFKPVLMANNGDLITVVFVRGTLKVQMSGRAQNSGKLHDQITVRNESTGQEYMATLIGKSLAVVGGVPDEATEKRLREMR